MSQQQEVKLQVTVINDDVKRDKLNRDEILKQVQSDWVRTGHSGSQLQLRNIKVDKGGLQLMHLMSALIDNGYIDTNASSTQMIDIAKQVASGLKVVTKGKAYRPDEQNIVKLSDGIYVENSWKDNNVKEIAYDDDDPNSINNVYVKHLEHTIGKEEASYLLDLSAYQVQQHFKHKQLTEAKPQIACAFISEEHGVGKGTHITFMQEALGESAVKVVAGYKALVFDKSSPQYWDTTFVVCDEAETTFKEGAKLYQELKAKTGLTTYEAEIKYENSSTFFATAVPMILTNGLVTSALHWLPRKDRHMFVTEWKRIKEDDHEQADYMEGIRNWFYNYDGAGQLKHLLLNRDWEANGFKPSNRALKTEAFHKATQSNSDDIVDDIKSVLLEWKSEDKFIYSPAAFDELFSNYNIHHSKIKKTKLIEAGLTQTGEIAINGASRKRAKYWVHEGTSIEKDKHNRNCIKVPDSATCKANAKEHLLWNCLVDYYRHNNY